MLLKAAYYYVCDKKRFNELMTTIDNSKICHTDVASGNRIQGTFRPWLAPALGWGTGSGSCVSTPFTGCTTIQLNKWTYLLKCSI